MLWGFFLMIQSPIHNLSQYVSLSARSISSGTLSIVSQSDNQLRYFPYLCPLSLCPFLFPDPKPFGFSSGPHRLVLTDARQCPKPSPKPVGFRSRDHYHHTMYRSHLARAHCWQPDTITLSPFIRSRPGRTSLNIEPFPGTTSPSSFVLSYLDEGALVDGEASAFDCYWGNQSFKFM